MVQAQFNVKLNCLRTNRGGECLSIDFGTYYAKVGLRRHLTTADTPHQNGISEWKNRTLMEAARILSFGANLPGFLWEEMVRAGNYLMNRCPTRALFESMPYQQLHKRRPNLAHARIIGSAAYVSLHTKNPSKLEARSVHTVLLGYDDCSKAYRCYASHSRKILIRKDVIVDENTSGISSATIREEVTLDSVLSTPTPALGPPPSSENFGPVEDLADWSTPSTLENSNCEPPGIPLDGPRYNL